MYIYIHICISYSSAKYTWLSISAAIIAVILTIVRYDHWSRVSIGMDYVLDLFILDVLSQVVDDVGWHSYYVQVYHYYYETKYIITITYIINYIIMYWIVIFLEATFPYSEKSSHTMFSSYSRPGFWYVTLIGISAQSGGNSWAIANPLNAPPQLSIPYVIPKQLWTLDELKAALIRVFPHLSTEEGQGCQR